MQQPHVVNLPSHPWYRRRVCGEIAEAMIRRAHTVCLHAVEHSAKYNAREALATSTGFGQHGSKVSLCKAGINVA